MIHIHRWTPTAVNQLERVFYNKRTGTLAIRDQAGGQIPITEVLQVCLRCDKLRTITLDGHWTLDEVFHASNR